MKLKREEAIELLSYRELVVLSDKRRESIIIDMVDEIELDSITDFADSKYDSLIMSYLKSSFIGTKNDFLQKSVQTVLQADVSIVGEPENLLCCPCCNYHTLKSRGQYFTCRVCFWEDDGNDDASNYSSANRMHLDEARKSFLVNGVYKLDAKKSVDINSRDIFLKCSGLMPTDTILQS